MPEQYDSCDAPVAATAVDATQLPGAALRAGLLRLRFDNVQLEREFALEYNRRHLPYLQFALLAGLFLYSVFGVLDALVAESVKYQLWFIRFAIAAPVMLVLLALIAMRRDWVVRRKESLTAVGSTIGGLGIVAMTVITHQIGVSYYYAGLMLVIMYVFGFLRMRCIAAFSAGAAMVVAYEIAVVVNPVVTAIDAVSSSFFVLSSAIIGMFTCYILERHERQRFVDLRTIDQDKQQLALLNRNLRDLALHDYLTGLLNRRLLDARLGEALAVYKRYGTECCLMLIDLDGFKEVNDRYGHAVGDEVLRAVARTLLQHVRETDLVYRYGGDEFCVLMPNTRAETTFFIGNRILDSLRRLQVLDGGGTLSVGFSAGCVEIDGRFANIAALLAEADRLLYRAKREGKGRLVAEPAVA